MINLDKYLILKNFFGHSEFREGQENIIDSLLSGRDVLCVMPTGAGKSVCYQIPALMLPGVTIVVSPLISLMKDQVNSLTQAGVRAAYINSSLTSSQYNKVLRLAAEGAYNIIYVAPERLEADDFSEACRSMDISLVAVDEAHCVSQWGQDFRPSYLKIAGFVSGLEKRPPVGAFTATATNEVRKDIAALLKLKDPYTVTTGFDRPNLYFGVIKPENKDAELLKLVSELEGKNGIVYCATRKNVEEVCVLLTDKGFSATRYHAGLSDDERRDNQEDFVYDRKSIMVATNAFGMGIDKSNVSFIIHYNMPKNMESYYQEAGRAGRDGGDADCILLYSPQDVYINKLLIERSEPNSDLDEETRNAVRKKDLERLKYMTYYCTTDECLRKYILGYFGEKAGYCCENCSNCNAGSETVDITVEAQKTLSCIVRTGQKFGGKMICDILRGSKSEKIISMGFNSLSTYGLMKDIPEKQVRRIIDALLRKGFLRASDPDYPVLKLLPAAGDVLRGTVRVSMKAPAAQTPKHSAESSAVKQSGKHTAAYPVDTALYDELKNLRSAFSSSLHVPAYIVFTDTALIDMCRRLPLTPEKFIEVSGVGKVKTERYGEAFMDVIRKYTESHPRIESKETEIPDLPEKEYTQSPNGELSEAYRPWTGEEDERLTSEYGSGLTISKISALHSRTRGAITSRLKKLGLK